MAAGSIVVDLLMKTGSFETDTARAAKSLKKLQKEAEDIGKAFGIAIVGAAGTLAYLVKSTLDANDHLQKLAQKTGIAADTLGGIGYAAQLAGGDLDSAGLAAGKLNKSLAEAAAGTKLAQEAFDAMGLSVKDAAGNTKTADVALAEIADKFAGYADGPEKAALALRIFGKAGADMIPLLNGGGDALRQQIEDFKKYSGFTEESAQQAEVFNDTMSRLKLLLGAFTQDVTSALLPALQAIADLFVKNREEAGNYEGVADKLAGTFKALTVAVAFAGTTFAATGDQIGALFAKANALAHLDFAGFKAIGEDASANLAKTKKDFLAFYDAVYAGRQKAIGSPVTPGAATKPNAPRLPGDAPRGGAGNAQRAFTGLSYDEQIAQKAAGLLEDSDVTRAKVFNDTLAKLDELYFNAGISGELYESAVKKLVGTTDTAAEAQRQYQAQMDEGRRLFESTRSPAEELAATQVHLNDLLAAGAIDWDTYGRAVFQAQDAYDAATKGADKAGKALDDFAKNAAENIQRSFGDTIEAAMEGNWKNIGDGFSKMLSRMVAEAAAAQITRNLFGADSNGGVSGTGGLLGGGLKWLGEVLGFGGSFASGGSPPVGKVSLVGERGPELFIPNSAGTVVPAGKTASMLGGQRPINLVQNFAGQVDRRTVQQAAVDGMRVALASSARGAA